MFVVFTISYTNNSKIIKLICSGLLGTMLFQIFLTLCVKLNRNIYESLVIVQFVILCLKCIDCIIMFEWTVRKFSRI